MTGKIVHTDLFSTTEGLNQLDINTNEYNNGMYMVVIQDGDKTYTSKLQIQH